MKARLFIGISTLALAGSAALLAQTSPETQQHCAAAQKAAGAELTNLFGRFAPICAETAAAAPARGGGGGGRAAGAAGGPAAAGAAGAAAGGGGGRATPPRESWYAEPAKVFDNFYFLGTKVHSAWALQTSQGLIVIDTLYEYATRDEIIEGLRKLKLDPAQIKYLIISHGHGDHHGGAKMVQDEFHPRVVLGGPDWDLVERGAPGSFPKRDIVATDGQKITLGDTTVTLYLTPGHTDGTISVIFPIKMDGRTHMIADWGGTALSRATTPENFKRYVDSAVRYRGILKQQNVEGIFSNHTEFDNASEKTPLLAGRKPGDPNPFLQGADFVQRYMTVIEEVGRAGLALPKP